MCSTTRLKLDTLPSEVHSIIIHYLSIRDLVRMFQVSRYWKKKIGNDRSLWRRHYEQHYGSDFVKDRWILWAVRRLWSQDPLEEKRLAARCINLSVLEYLDGYTWFRLIRGRVLTERNWRNNTPQRSVAFQSEQLDGLIRYESFIFTKSTYGVAFVAEKYNRLGFAIVDDTLDITKPIPVPKSDTPSNRFSLLNILRGNKSVNKSSIPIGRVALSSQTMNKIRFLIRVTSDEFIVANRFINEKDQDPQLVTKVILAWNIGRLEKSDTDNQPCYIPRLCMSELLPNNGYFLLKLQGGWLLVQNTNALLPNSSLQESRHYLLYDVRRGRLAMAFSVKDNIWPVLGKATADKIQIYCCYITSDNTSLNTHTSEILDSVSCQYHWYVIEVSIRSNIKSSMVDLGWYDRIPTPDIMETVTKRYHDIVEYADKHEYWCDDAYDLKTIKAKETIRLSVLQLSNILACHLVEDLFAISCSLPHSNTSKTILVHTVNQQRVLWSKSRALTHIVVIPEEKAILNYAEDGTVQLLNMYTGSVLNSFKFRGCKVIRHIIGPLCYISHLGGHTLIDVRTGEKIRTLLPSQLGHSFLNPELRFRRYTPVVNAQVPTRVEYFNRDYNDIWIDEYAQV
jgi:hypothetical protein